MATHGIPEEISTDNGSPYFGREIANYAKRMGFRHHQVTPLDPKSNGLAENFAKLTCKLVHTSLIEGKDPKKELNRYLLQYRSMPHITSGKSPAELLFGRRIQSKLPQFHPQTETKEISDVTKHQDRNKLLQKAHADKRQRSKLKMINKNDKVLIK